MIEGLHVKEPVIVATKENITLSGLQQIDGITLSANDRVLVKDQTDKKKNGLYKASSTGWIRTDDMSTGSNASGTYVFVKEGSTYADNGFVCITDSPNDIVDTNDINFVQFTNLNGSVQSAAKLTTARNIGGVSFDGSSDIDLPGVNTEGNQNTTGSAATLTTARNIGGVSFNGSSDIDLPGVNTGNQNTTGSAATLTTARNIGGVSFNGSSDIDLPGVNTAGNQNTTGSAATLTTARNIGGVSFNGSSDIDLPGVNTEGNQNTTGSAATLITARNIGGVSFNSSSDIDLPGVNTEGNQNTTGSAATLTTARNIGGVSFNGSLILIYQVLIQKVIKIQLDQQQN